MSRRFLVPGPTWKPAAPYVIADSVLQCFTRGYDSSIRLRELVGKQGVEWQAMDMGAGMCDGWNL